MKVVLQRHRMDSYEPPGVKSLSVATINFLKDYSG
jgi:hypothetical protein